MTNTTQKPNKKLANTYIYEVDFRNILATCYKPQQTDATPIDLAMRSEEGENKPKLGL